MSQFRTEKIWGWHLWNEFIKYKFMAKMSNLNMRILLRSPKGPVAVFTLQSSHCNQDTTSCVVILASSFSAKLVRSWISKCTQGRKSIPKTWSSNYTPTTEKSTIYLVADASGTIYTAHSIMRRKPKRSTICKSHCGDCENSQGSAKACKGRSSSLAMR